jgi:hypothetical protein
MAEQMQSTAEHSRKKNGEGFGIIDIKYRTLLLEIAFPTGKVVNHQRPSQTTIESTEVSEEKAPKVV